MRLKQEARLLSARTGLRDTACEKWMKHAGIDSIMDLRTRYPGKAHAECMELAIAEIESFICEGAPGEIEITPAMVEAGKEVFREHWIGIREGYEEDLEIAVIAAFRRMMHAAKFRSLVPRKLF